MKKLILKKKPKRLTLYKKQSDLVISDDLKRFHNHLDNQLNLFTNKEKKLEPLKLNVKYHYKDRMPPNDISIKVKTYSSNFTPNTLPAAVLLQHYITMTFMKLKPLHPVWSIIGKETETTKPIRRSLR